MTVLAIALALLGACFFAGSVSLQHDAVRAQRNGAVRLTRLARSRTWQAGALLGVAGTGLHLTALSLAPLAIVQPLGVLSLVLTVLAGRATATRRVRIAALAVCIGVGGFVLVSASGGSASPDVTTGAVVLAVLAGPVVAAAGLSCRGRGRCAGLAAAAAVLFGLGSAVLRAAALELSTVVTAAGFALGGAALLAAGGWLLQQAHAAGPTAVVVGATTVLDPLTAVTADQLLYGETPHLVPAMAVARLVLALLAVTGVLVLAGSLSDPPELDKEPLMADPLPPAGLRILLGADTFPPDINGAAHFTARLAHGLAGLGHDVHVLRPRPRADATDHGPLTVHDAPSLGTPFHPTFRIGRPGVGRAAEELLDRIRPDVVHVQSHFAVGRALLAAARRRGVPTVATNHFMPENLLGYVRLPSAVREALIRFAWRDLVRVYRGADTITTPTPRAADLLARNGIGRPVTVISCGVDLEHYAARATPSGGDAAVVFVGRLDAEKNVDELVRAVARVPRIRAEIVGDGSCRAALTELAAELGVADRVRFHGFVPDAELVRIYGRGQLFCMPGTAELQSLATMEAMAAGLPVVAADAMALPHLVHNGHNGYLYPPGDVAALAARLAELAGNEDRRAAMGAAGRQLVARHDLTRTLNRFETLYRPAAALQTAVADSGLEPARP
ncbi:glycosyltransferase [Amycolatopsis saalfeldensis]|uniref:Glycosyltransferase involved in cell wall bisynthesis n=1 Tax=Amycolatopsis saalfeldensis TaxID=394193 RepID=A0A1H8SAW8_9PSEU|nr:glycosyltransferase [Amycolatopsis saalfeldensis]SEO75860.1 Glycosyltransferase involved in cell wall bisynthesis [Amycolatopsis saalfeldensis]